MANAAACLINGLGKPDANLDFGLVCSVNPGLACLSATHAFR